MSRLGHRQLMALAEAMPARRRRVVETIAAFRFVSGGQLRRCCYQGETARWARMELADLTASRVLARLDRRVGGVRAGSDGYVYTLGPVGRRLIEYFAGRGLPRARSTYEPGEPFVAHALAISEVYVSLLEAERERRVVELLEVVAEPSCWRSYVGRLGGREVLKPDLFVRLGVGDEELSWFVEVDRGTERLGALERKHRAYLAYFRTGQEQAERGVFPRVVWSVPDLRRGEQIRRVAERLGPDAAAIFTTCTAEQTVAALTEDESSTTGAAA